MIKRFFALIAAIAAVCLLLGACAPEGFVYPGMATQAPVQTAAAPSPSPTGRPTPAKTAAPTPPPTPAPTPAPTPTPTPEPTPEPEPAPTYTTIYIDPFEDFLAPESDTVVFAGWDGTVYFGYSGGRWLTRNEAAAYCGGKLKFTSLSLGGKTETLVSNVAVETNEGLCSDSYAVNGYETTYDGWVNYSLGFSGSPGNYLCSISPDYIPEIKPIEDVSHLLPAMQSLVDQEFGTGKVVVSITSAVQADIDGDGLPETIINASNYDLIRDDESVYDIYGYSYSIACAIRADGTYVFLKQRFSMGYGPTESYVRVRGLVDVDKDGVCEVLLERAGYEAWETELYRITNEGLSVVASRGWAS